MKKTIMVFAVLALSTFANAETTTSNTTSNSNYDSHNASMDSNHYDTNSNDRFNNRDTRTNSTATPATVGKENSKLSDSYSRRNNRNSRLNTQNSATTYNTDSNQPAPINRGTAASDSTVYNSQSNRVNTTGSSTAGAAAAGSNYNTDKTAQDQGTAEKELELTRKIRSEITDNKDLSTDAHNIKIITDGGKVLLKGPVKSAAEKSQVEMIAKRLAGNTAVINQTYVEKK